MGAVHSALAVASDDTAAASLAAAGTAEYDDVFTGVSMPDARKIAKRFVDLDEATLDELLFSEVHEHRMTALLIMVLRSRESPSQSLVDHYLAAARAGRVNGPDLVDASAEVVLGEFLVDRPRNVLFSLAKSDQLWERRIALVSTLAFIKHGDSSTTLDIAEKLSRERNDLTQQAVGWMLREVGDRIDRSVLTGFLDAHAGRMPQVSVFEATEHLDDEVRARYRSVARARGE